MSQDYQPETMTRADTAQLQGPVVLDFGTNWCSICNAARPKVDAALAQHPQVRHIRIEDGSGRRLGREFGVKLWPALFFVRDGHVVGELVRPHAQRQVEDALQALHDAAAK